MRFLHITNGDGAAGILKASSLTGDVLPWRDPMHHGPFPAEKTLEELRPIRAAYLAGPGGNPRPIARDIRLRDDHLRAAPTYDNVVLWFEHDLLDQLQILQLLDWFATAEMDGTGLEIICINSFPGMDRFRGIGELDTVQMASLFDQRLPVTKEMLELAQNGWRAFRSDTPNDLLQFIKHDLGCLPYLKAALERHVQEFPSLDTGLTRTEFQLLSLVSGGLHGPVELFWKNMDLETALFIGDWGTYRILDRLCQAGLLVAADDSFWFPPMSADARQKLRDQRLALTDLGARVIAGDADAHGVLERDDWLGGVHIKSGTPAWHWDASSDTLVLQKP